MKRIAKTGAAFAAGLLGLGLLLAGAGCSRETPVESAAAGSAGFARPVPGQPFSIADLGLEMRPIPAGSFRMGSDFGEPGRTSAEGPPTKVTLSRGFWLGATPVTHGQWRALMSTDLSGQGEKAFGAANELTRRLGAVEPDVAMYFVNWRDALEFCARLNERARAAGVLPDGYEFTLPTEAQWEYACRAGTTGATYGPELDAIAWYADNSRVNYDGPPWNAIFLGAKPGPGGRSGPRQVGLKQPNAWGLHDTLGNVYEWCRDFRGTALPGGTVTDPPGSPVGSDRSVRGGSWHSGAGVCRAAYRAWSSPDSRTPFTGFRVALAPVQNR